MGEKMGEDGEEEDLKELGGGICEEGIMELRKIQMASKPTGRIFRRPALKGTPMATRDFHQLVSRGRAGEIGETWNLLYSYSYSTPSFLPDDMPASSSESYRDSRGPEDCVGETLIVECPKPGNAANVDNAQTADLSSMRRL